MGSPSVRAKRLGKLPIPFLVISVAPALALTAYFILYPTLRALMMSLTDSTSVKMSGVNLIWFENYAYLFRDKRFVQALSNTLRLMLVVPPVTIAAALILAALLTQAKLRESGLYRTLFFFPSIVSMTVVGIVWSFVFHPSMGILNTLLRGLGAGGLARPWLGDSGSALWCVGAALVWQAAGYYMVMHIAAIDSISRDIYEAATIDGASGVRQFFSITIPNILDIIGITYVLSLSGTINLSYVLSTVMTGGGPNGASTVLLQYMYNQGMGNANFGYAMSITVFTLAISIALSVLSRRLTGQREKGV